MRTPCLLYGAELQTRTNPTVNLNVQTCTAKLYTQ